jgi:ubiquinone/menaquinone biosynthesis C-methylase UbiE
MARIDFIQVLHSSTKRNYVQRVVDHEKAECARIAKQWGKDYWDGERCYGYGGYRYDGRWRPIAEAMVKYYGIKPGDKVLDVGCGKGYLLYEFTQVVPGVQVSGLDISTYAIENSKEEIRPFLKVGNASCMPYRTAEFDFIVSLGALHNLPLPDLWQAIGEIERVGRSNHKYIMVESFRNDKEKTNLLYWQLTCETFLSPESWEWLSERIGYTGDMGYIYFE